MDCSFARLCSSPPSPSSPFPFQSALLNPIRSPSTFPIPLITTLKLSPRHDFLRRSPFNRILAAEAPVSPILQVSDSSCAGKLRLLVDEFQKLEEPIDRVKRLLHYAGRLPAMEEASRVDSNRVTGCTANVWVEASMDDQWRIHFKADSDSEITRGFCACLVWVLDEARPEDVLELKTEELSALNVGVAAQSRANTWYNVLVSMKKRTKLLVAEREGGAPYEPFPSLVISENGVEAKGSYAEAQARFLSPDEVKVEELVNALKSKKIGVVAHFYMDPEVQGVLTAAQKQWPHINISDSLAMSDAALKMAKSGCQFITVLGVDFMSENVRAILDQAGFREVGVYRMSSERIGCTLADAAATPTYLNYLKTAASCHPSLHVIYINTSLETKAHAHEIIPTITCTSSNVVQTILQAFAQVEKLNVWYGPDAYMGANIRTSFEIMGMMTNKEIAEIHPQHNRDTIESFLPRMHYYEEGACVVHHIFGHEVVKRINDMYCDTYLAAHLEVPGEMFSLAMEAKRRGMGVVGSTQNILDFITDKVRETLERNVGDHLQFILGTESGMITSIVEQVGRLLTRAKHISGRKKINVEIIFPVSSDSITKTPKNESTILDQINFGDLSIVPGVASGEGCSVHGGCASCPYMKMNSLESLLDVCSRLPHDREAVSAQEAGRFGLLTPAGKLVSEIGCEPILHMRSFQATKMLPAELTSQILGGSKLQQQQRQC